RLTKKTAVSVSIWTAVGTQLRRSATIQIGCPASCPASSWCQTVGKTSSVLRNKKPTSLGGFSSSFHSKKTQIPRLYWSWLVFFAFLQLVKINILYHLSQNRSQAYKKSELWQCANSLKLVVQIVI